jgi:predicted RNase H-like HicB family nuclease
MEQTYNYAVRIEPVPEGGFNAFIPALACATWGETREDAATAAREAAETFIESLLKDHEPIPVETDSVSFIQLGIKVHVAA